MVLCDAMPESKLPQCWSDDVRMNALFAPFRLKSANPESWEMKMKFWSDMVRQWCRHKMDPVVSASDVKCVFQRKGRTAACIDIVIEEMYRASQRELTPHVWNILSIMKTPSSYKYLSQLNGELSPVLKYQQILHNGPEGWVKWGARLAFKPAVFALTAVSYLLPARQAVDNDGLPKASIESTQRFVVESAVKEQANDFLDKYPPGAERIGTVEELMRVSNWSGGRETFEIVLGYLVSQGVAVKKGDVVKIADSTSRKVSAISETDEAIARLSATETRLEGDLARLSRDVAAADTDARAALKLGNKLAAKNHLRRKHVAQQKLSRCESTLDNVKQLLLSAKDAGSNAAVVDTYRTSVQALKRTMKEGGLDEDGVHDTMDELKEVMDTYNEVEKALGGTIDDVDIAELEEELKELMIGPGAPGGGTPGKEEREWRGINFPSPPKEEPSRRVLERDFVFDGEKQMLEELEHLDEPVARGKGVKLPVALADTSAVTSKRSSSSSPKATANSSSSSDAGWGGTPAEGYGELRTDQRIHPGQPINVDFSRPPTHYTTDFQVQDHTAAKGIWLYNDRDGARDEFSASTEYYSTESPGKTGGTFQMAPGGERKPHERIPEQDE